MRPWITLFARLILVAGTSLLGACAVADDLQLKVQKRLDGLQVQYGFPGATVAYVLPDGSRGTAATGLADVEAATPMTPQTRMLAASIGKSFVAATVLALESEELLSRADLVSRYLAERPWFRRLPNHETITIGDLLRHTSGLPDHVHMQGFAAAMAGRVRTGQDTNGPEDAIRFVLDQPPLFAPGAEWSYSDTGYLVLGLVIEKVTGRAYYDWVQKRFFQPLELAQTAPSNKRVLPGLAVGYTAPGNPYGLPPRTMDRAGRLLWDPKIEWTGGGLMSTAHDLAVWGDVLFRGQAMPTPYLDRLLDAVSVAPTAPDTRYGAGVAIYAKSPRGRVYGHGGWVPGYVSSLRHYADHGVTIALQINTDVGIVDESSDLMPTLEAALADLIISAIGEVESACCEPAAM